MPKNSKSQLDMIGLLNPKVGAMRRLREMRRKAGFVEVTVWVPAEQRERIKKDAAALIEQSGKHFPSVADK